MPIRPSFTVSLALCVLASAGCNPSTPVEQVAPVPLAEVTVPADFRFANTQPVEVTVRAASGLLAPGEQGSLEVVSAAGKTLFRGPLRAGESAQLRLSLPLADTSLSATLATGSGTASAKSTLSGGVVALELR
jgi:hypothetical protein